MHSGFHDDRARSIAATLLTPRSGEQMAVLPSGLALSVLDGPDAGRYEVAGAEFYVGRGRLCDVRLNDASVSERHFKLSLGDGEILLQDLDSRNGVWIGRARVRQATLLPGAVFRAGSCRLRLDAINTTSTAVVDDTDFHGVRAASQAMRSIFALLGRTARTPISILLTGETGSGKGAMARAIHRASGRKGNFVTLDCTALPRDMAEGLVLGHVKGAFTGAHRDRPSPFEEADGGTLFLDEIGELPLELQPKLLRVLDEQVVQRVGSNQVRRVDVRTIAATHRDVTQGAETGEFRADLLHRLAGMTVRIPALRSRREDVPVLAGLFLAEFGGRIGRELRFSEEAAGALRRMDWPGNVRELRQVVQRSAYLAEEDVIEVGDLLLEDGGPGQAVRIDGEAAGQPGELRPLEELVDELQRAYCTRLLEMTSSTAEAAAIAGYSPRGLRMLLGRLGLPTVHPSRKGH